LGKYRIKIYDHIKKEIIKHLVVEASSISIAAKLAEIHNEDLRWEHKDTTIEVDEIKDDD
jgi:hypothetical protein|tara:strand:- start:294 stop:473 length:180 start_codon:yes stop_codon:yes gene_type:complete